MNIPVIKMVMDTTILCLGIVFGSALGSGVLCLVSRKIDGISWTRGRSHCDACHHQLQWQDLIPIMSFIVAGGRCRHCHAEIPRECLTTEVLFGLLGLLVATSFTNFAASTPMFLRLFFIAGPVLIGMRYIHALYTAMLLCKKKKEVC